MRKKSIHSKQTARLWQFNNYYGKGLKGKNVRYVKTKISKSAYITRDTYNSMKDNQNSRCAICQRREADLGKSLCIDHCHETGKIRGLLCDRCNRGIGWFRDNPNLLALASQYLKQEDYGDIEW